MVGSMLSIIILSLVFILIAVRQIGNVKLGIWQIMLLGAIAVLVSGQITLQAALGSINVDVMLFLFGMFVVGQALDESGYLSHISCIIFRSAKTLDNLLFLVIFGAGFASAFLMNDTLAIIGTPLMLHLAQRYDLAPKVLLLSLAFAITIGSAMSPIGNPQNLLIALSGSFANPFLSFISALFLPTILNLFVCYILMKYFYHDEFHQKPISHPEEHIKDKSLAWLCSLSLVLMSLMILTKIAVVSLIPSLDFKLTYVALVAALPILILSPKRMQILRQIDWATLIFFASMFILMESVWESGFFQSLLANAAVDIASPGIVLAVSVILSQFISNVPLVALYLPMLLHSGVASASLIALAAGSTIAGNMTILGAASNVIIIQNTEAKNRSAISFLEFVKVGIPLTLANAFIYWVFLSLF